MYNYYKLNLFLVVIGKFDPKSNFQPDWPELGLIRADRAKMGENMSFKSLE